MDEAEGRRRILQLQSLGGSYDTVVVLILLLIEGICGATGQAIVGFRGGILVSIAIGFIVALIGMWLSGALGMREMFAVNVGGKTSPIVWSTIGATLFVVLIGLFRGRRFSRHI
jgi:uncharacterized membrane protein YeaQ/YmgE (transglycosylase-associated protein family)